jgi:hypothetical protein
LTIYLHFMLHSKWAILSGLFALSGIMVIVDSVVELKKMVKRD